MSLLQKFPHRLQIQTPATTRTAALDRVESFATTATWRCFIQPASATETDRRGRRYSEQTHTIYGPDRTGSTAVSITDNDRLVTVGGARTFEVLGVLRHGESGIGGMFARIGHLEVAAKEI